MTSFAARFACVKLVIGVVGAEVSAIKPLVTPDVIVMTRLPAGVSSEMFRDEVVIVVVAPSFAERPLFWTIGASLTSVRLMMIVCSE